jgi:hypothetical protein
MQTVVVDKMFRRAGCRSLHENRLNDRNELSGTNASVPQFIWHGAKPQMYQKLYCWVILKRVSPVKREEIKRYHRYQ